MAHKKGQGSSRNGRDSNAQQLETNGTQAKASARAKITLCLRWLMDT